jgi:serine-type D-Ala-D-Ala carboxypeptidase/endopeptidase (penicillin-binding protein 4)
MMKTLIGLCFFLMVNPVFAQPIKQQLDAAIKKLEADSQMRHAIVGFCVVDTKTGLPVYEHNAQIGLAAASTQKLFTSGAAFDLLGKDYKYKTQFAYTGTLKDGTITGDLYIVGSGDPTLGSWRFQETRADIVIRKWTEQLKKRGVLRVNGDLKIVSRRNDAANSSAKRWPQQTIPGGWIWDDIGNYYGASATFINWRENQYDITFYPGNEPGQKVDSFTYSSPIPGVHLFSELTTGPKGSGDNAYIYLPLGQTNGVIAGTIPAGEKKFTISGSVQNPAFDLASTLQVNLRAQPVIAFQSIDATDDQTTVPPITSLIDIYSPPLDSINYWFLKRSINLYGEALLKTIAIEKAEVAYTEKGAELIRDFWAGHGIEKSAIHIIDGSGLSPQNRVTTDALVKVLQYAKTRPWYNSFYYALPEYNGMKMKSGSIGGARAFAGYHTAKDGREYSYAIVINNYDGSSSQAVKKIYQVLDLLK